MITKNYIKTIVNGIMSRIKKHEITEDELIDLLNDMCVVDPITDSNGNYYVNETGKIYIL